MDRTSVIGIDHPDKALVSVEKVVDEPDQHGDAGSWSGECKPCKALDESSHKVFWKVCRRKKDVAEVEKSCLVLDMKDLRCEELVELGVEMGVLQVVLRDQGEDIGERQEGEGAPHGVTCQQEVSQEQGSG